MLRYKISFTCWAFHNELESKADKMDDHNIGVSYLVNGHEFYFKDGNLTWLKSGSNKALSLFLFQWLNSQSGKQQLL